MLNAHMVNALEDVFRRRLFANLFSLLAGFHDSRIRLNIIATSGLTNGMGSRAAASANIVFNNQCIAVSMRALNKAAKDICYTYIKLRRQRETRKMPLEWVNKR
jgi:hypothetical protein